MTADEQPVYSGYKNAHTMLLQAVATTHGLILSLSGPGEGKYAGAGIPKCPGLQDIMYRYEFNQAG